MAIRVSNIRVPIDDESSNLDEYIAKKLKINSNDISSYAILKRALDARKEQICYVYTIEVEVVKDEKAVIKKCRFEPKPVLVQKEAEIPFEFGEEVLRKRPLIIGAGPAGLFAALLLAESGYRPIVLERGYDVDRRTKDIQTFWSTGQLNLDSNVQFGEGGAGTFSDGKLTTRINDPRINKVFNELVKAGAPEEILYVNKPHVGTDKLRLVVKTLREKIIELGGEIRFGSKVTELIIENKKVTGLIVNNEIELLSEVVILAIGNSARDTYEKLYEQEINIVAKPFAIGVRVEHPQRVINEAQYGKFATHPKLGAADYQLVHKDQEKDRTAYSFCMCPGGVVVAATSEAEQVVTNGMSYYSRDSGVANSALVVSVKPEDFGGYDNPLGGISFQRRWEKAAYKAGGSNYSAPVQRIDDFLNDRETNDLEGINIEGANDNFMVKPSYRPGVTPANLDECLPEFVIKTLQGAMYQFNSKIKNFNLPNGTMTGVETRTSAPVRISRGDDYQSVSHEGLFPAGEGAGYAGGIVSAAVDGIRVAEAVMRKYKMLQ